ncbi:MULTISPECIES: deoxyribose-phosphate aldolase [Turicibacter]|jgi:deoxyribose-phosphate aldolase|uniref:Deoxyribose-phosphate aldolase n=2 Tax=Turicibacter sanguinis TaxID=154288 RepID=A0A173QWG8_9FIRM|nr:MULTISPECIES: deoxyribose-phosphate aldolase [Turicibacter]EFF63907.1 deoxyribose-phosphate aldolase [Turicibacter sanguinis PC909]EGC92011.1 deoxyribose-phosphate aldolase [Turicibacter sp. HGF1]MBP3905455.1 deoxyribose-phosphate aldolase [Turicibacter sp.]MCU7192243.1 deoxyribose-phosphate aldolase [Turicibacter sanguinis]MCU7196315.1 deoxyribose-phosphate aldolase [Turicibacter sanguinis]
MEVNKYIDHTILKPETTKAQILTLCEEAKQFNFASVCVNPTWVATCANELKGTDVKVCTVIGFPLGATFKEVKAYETKLAIENGASEIDMVINVGAAKDQNWELVYEDIKAVVEAANGVLVKVIIETCLLTDEEKVKACEMAVKAGAHFVKTSTGFSTGGATAADVALMRQTVGESVGVKASGGVRTAEDMKVMVEAGANRIGTSGGVSLVQGKENTTAY